MCSLITGNTTLCKSQCEQALKYCALAGDNASTSEQAEVLSVNAVCQSMDGDDRQAMATADHVAQLDAKSALSPVKQMMIKQNAAKSVLKFIHGVDTVGERILRKLPPESSAQLAYDVARVRIEENKVDEAETLFKRAVSLFAIQDDGGNNFGSAMSMSFLAGCFDIKKDYAQAEDWSKKSVAKFKSTRKRFPNIDQITGGSIKKTIRDDLLWLANLYHKEGKLDLEKGVRAEMESLK
jgi:hypothetical protein